MRQGVPPERQLKSAWRGRVWLWAASLACAMAAGGLLAVSLHALHDSFGWVEHTEEVLLRATQVEDAVLSAESNARDYRIDGATHFLEAFGSAQRQAREGIAELQRLVADNPVQGQRLEALKPLVEQRFALLTALTALDLQHRDQALALMRDGASLQERSRIQEALGEFRRMELDLLARRQALAGRAELRLFALAALTAAVAIAAALLGFFVGLRDRNLARLGRLELRLAQISRLDAIGQSAAGLAHEISQPLAASGSYVQAAQRFLASGDAAAAGEAREALELATLQLGRAGDVLRRLRTFIAGKHAEPSVESVQELVQEAITLLALARHEGLELRGFEAGPVPPVKVDRVQVIQVLVNLMRNAVKAMESSPRRVLGVAAGAQGDHMVRISVSDTGPGLPPAVASRLFELFTSGNEGGMGVGLSICRTLVEAQGGRIWTQPNEGGGTIFHFTVRAAP